MSGTNGKPGVNSAGFGSHIPSIEEKNRQVQQETMMEKLRAKYRNKPKSYEEIKKSVRMYFIEKHYPLDPLCKATLQSALDKLQHYIKVTSRHGLVERLESLSRQLGLKFMEDQQLLFISTDMFYVEILLDTSGNLSDVKVHHECKIEQQSSELVNCLKRGDFADFTVQLEGLSSIYQLNAEPKIKKKAFVALQAMETDIYSLYQMQAHTEDDSYEIMSKSPVGLVLERRGGHPMKLTYFCPPIHLPDGDSKAVATCDFSIDQVIRSPNGLSATVNLEGSSANKLQIMPIASFSRDAQSGLELPTYAPLTQNNSMLMPATFVLRLNKPMPVCSATLRALGLPLASEVCSGGASETAPPTTVMNLIVQNASKNAIKSTQKGLYVNLPKETHCYFFTDNRKLQGTLISSLPFTEPAQVPKIITFLKKQALFYTLLSSCVREQQKQYNDMESTVILEVTAVSFNQVTVELQHPYEESLATVDFLLEDCQVTCTIYCLNNNYEALSQKLTRTVRKVLSIPMVIYKLLKCWDEEHQQKLCGAIGAGASGGSGFGSSNASVTGSGSGGTLPTSGATGGGNSSFSQFGMETGSSDAAINFTSMSNLKMDAKVRSLADSFAASTSAAVAIAGLINLKRETDPSTPTSSSTMASASINKIELNQPSTATNKASDIEIADKYKNIWKDKTPNLKHCVSITPIPGDGKVSQVQQQQQQVTSNPMDVTRTGGIEIIPLNAQVSSANTSTSNAAATTITITPITGKDPQSKEKKTNSSTVGSSTVAGSGVGTKRPHDSGSINNSGSSNTSSSSTDIQKEKKRKKKRDDSPMGPPEKVYSRQNSPAASGDPSSVSGVVRKFSSPSSSPKGGSSCSGLMASVPQGPSLSARPSPKHSPVYSSPKHNTASNSPKSPFGTHSPKHGSSGKPSMSTLKSATAATSLSPKGEKSGSGSVVAVSATTTTSGSNSPALARSFAGVSTPVPPLTSSVASSGVKREKDKVLGNSSSCSVSGSNVMNSGSSVGGGVLPATAASVAAAVAAATALKTSQQQQLKPSVASLSHLAAGSNINPYTVSGHGGSTGAGGSAALELNALRKGMAGGAVSPFSL